MQGEGAEWGEEALSVFLACRPDFRRACVRKSTQIRLPGGNKIKNDKKNKITKYKIADDLGLPGATPGNRQSWDPGIPKEAGATWGYP